MSISVQKLGELVTIKGGGTPSKKIDEYWNGDIPWASVKDLKTRVLSKAEDYITTQGAENSATNIIPKGTIIVPTRMALGKVAIAGVDLAINQDLKALFIKDENVLDKQYLARFLESKAKYIEGEGKGATVKGITLDFLKSIDVPLPPPAEQKRIAAILDKADTIRQKRKQAIDLADEFLRSVFLDMFGDPVTNPKGFPLGTIRDLVDTANYGTSGKASETDGEFPVLRMGNITYQGGWDFTDLKYIDLTEKELPKYLVHRGDLLFNRTNSRELVGKTAVYNQDEPMAFAGYLVRVRPNELGNNYYISGYLNSGHGKKVLVGMCKSIVGMANINAQELQDIKILLPPIEIQNQYESLAKSVYEKTMTHKSSSTELELLFNSLSQKAFSGEL
ncbi:restriction endonuclease subunit S [Vibrio sp. 10N.222.54.F6]|uniref:restriction endonuclease subunit S n=1 Tax=unclassified Vibrio TaxID=2614977 RepID=UPI000C81AB86|nr:restriction endonuclease subunit S [Vibrio sp. 10N.261.51.A7]PML74519.1 restriction endonuclease [Vibrio sp. 10N.261.51.A7]